MKAAALMLAGALLAGCNSDSETQPSPSPTPSPTVAAVTEAQAAGQFCDELPRLLEAIESVEALHDDPTPERVTETVTLFNSEAGRLDVVSDAYREAGNPLKASDIQALADGLRTAADGFDAILRGEPTGATANIAILVEQALDGVDC